MLTVKDSIAFLENPVELEELLESVLHKLAKFKISVWKSIDFFTPTEISLTM